MVHRHDFKAKHSLFVGIPSLLGVSLEVAFVGAWSLFRDQGPFLDQSMQLCMQRQVINVVLVKKYCIDDTV